MTTPREHSRQQLEKFTRELRTDELTLLAATYAQDIRAQWYEAHPDEIAAAIDDLNTITNHLRNRLTP